VGLTDRKSSLAGSGYFAASHLRSINHGRSRLLFIESCDLGQPKLARRALNCMLALSVGLTLAGCRTGLYTSSIGPNEYSISGTSPGGMFGGFVGTAPSESAVAEAAARLCPKGYDKIDKDAGTFFEGKYIRWIVKCRYLP
jgi:hypothetical protein